MNQEFEFLMYRAAEEDVTVNAVIKDEVPWPNYFLSISPPSADI